MTRDRYLLATTVVAGLAVALGSGSSLWALDGMNDATADAHEARTAADRALRQAVTLQSTFDTLQGRISQLEGELVAHDVAVPTPTTTVRRTTTTTRRGTPAPAATAPTSPPGGGPGTTSPPETTSTTRPCPVAVTVPTVGCAL